MSKMSRDKGKRGEREIVDLLKSKGLDAKRSGYFQVHKAGGDRQEYPDVLCKELEDFWIEVKRVERLSIHSAMDQAVFDANGSGRIPLVMFRKNGSKWNAALPLETLLELLEKVRNG